MPAPKGFCIRLFVTKKAVRNSSLLRTNPDRQTALWIYLFRTYILTVQRKQLSCWSCNHSHYVHMESVSLLTSIWANRCDVFGGIRVFLICSVASELPLVTTLLPFAFTIPLLSASDYSEVHLLLQKLALDIFAVKFWVFRARLRSTTAQIEHPFRRNWARLPPSLSTAVKCRYASHFAV